MLQLLSRCRPSGSGRTFLLLLMAASALAACGGGGGETGEEAPAGPRVESPELGIAIASVPAGFEVTGVEDGVLELRHETGGMMEMTVDTPEVGGVNLVAAVREHEAKIGARPGSEYKGQQELMTANLGTAYYSRGVWEEEGELREEAAVFLLHPTGDRQLTVVYRYPSGDDSQSRIQDELFAVVGELEDFGTPAETTPGPAARAGAGANGNETATEDAAPPSGG